MTELSEQYQRGAEAFERAYPQRATKEPSDFEKVSMEHLFAEIWNRPGLSTRDRRLLILGVAAAQGNDTILKLQLRSGLAKGDLTEDDLTEVPIFLTHYVGWPLGVVTNGIARQVLADKAAKDQARADQSSKESAS
jgi:4-carboxymuconolactone decarboxylase